LREQAPDLAALVDPMLGITFSPTRITASDKVNVIPSRARLEVDCRVPPGAAEPLVCQAVQDVLGPDGYELTFDTRRVGNRSPARSTLMSAIGAWIGEADPGAATVPVVDPGFTDSHWFRAAFPECAAYGFFPQRHMSRVETSALIHGPDERIDLRDLGLATRFFAELPDALLGWSAPARLVAAA
jgi:acetylornithine deacetylase/succinyl-diaminopimelate desuccinylase-like protein